MNKEMKSLLKKSAKIAGVTCISVGAIAIITSGAALKAVAEGGKYLANAVKRIANEQDVTPEVQDCTEVISDEDFAAAENAPAEGQI